MKTFCKIIFLLFALLTANAAFSQIKVTGKVIDNQRAPLEFSNVVLQSPDTIFGTSADEQGNFELKALKGNYALKITMLGYDAYEKEITLQSDINLGEIQLSESSTALKEVVVKARRITRMADRFIVNLVGDSTIFGKSGKDILNTSPGVFMQERDGSVSVNGKMGTQIYVNERPLHYSGTDLVRYFQNLKAEDIAKIEVLPNAGSEYDASVTGGIIKITLKHRRDDGMDGSIGVYSFFAPSDKDFSNVSPYFSMNYRYNKLSLYANLNYTESRMREDVITDVDTWSINQSLHSVFQTPQSANTGQIRLGGIYDLSDKQSVGLEVNYSDQRMKANPFGDLTNITGGNQTDITSNYNTKMTTGNYSASANYLLRLDSLGSMFKVLLDYFHNKSDNSEDYHALYSGYMNVDSIYRSDIPTINNTYAVTADLSHHFNDHTMLNGGVKYARNEMNNSTLYEYLQGVNWNTIEPLSNVNSFTENISAIYALFSSRIQKVSYSLGLRGEYTDASPWTNQTDAIEKQQYFKLFPSINVMLPFGENGKHSVTANYHRSITRPSFSQLNPYRVATTEYLSIAGNPKLQPALADDGSISLNLFYKYNLTAGVTNMKGYFGQVFISDPNIQGAIMKTIENVTQYTNWYLSINGMVNITKWWQMYVTMTGRNVSSELLGEKRSNNNFFGYMNNTFSLPKDIKLDVGGYYYSSLLDGNLMVKPTNPYMSATLRKQFLKNRLTATLFVNDIFNTSKSTVETNETDFTQVLMSRYSTRMIGASLSYYFQSGGKVSNKKVETGAAEEKARLK